MRDRPAGLKFRRQCPAGRYVLDFYCAEARLALEVDGAAHDMGHNWQRDAARDRYFADHGITTLRISATAIRDDLPAVLDQIVAAALARRPLHRPAPPAGPPPRVGEETKAGSTSPLLKGEGDRAQHGGGAAPQARRAA